jgi:hypothetical protein
MRVIVHGWTIKACLVAGIFAALQWGATEGFAQNPFEDDVAPPIPELQNDPPLPPVPEVGEGFEPETQPVRQPLPEGLPEPGFPGAGSVGPALPESATFPPMSPEARGDLGMESMPYDGNGVPTLFEEEQTYLFPQYWPVRLRGWLDGGYMGNTRRPASRFHGPYNAVDRDEIMGNQAYLIAEAGEIPTNGCWGVGARADVLYGEDFFLAQSIGMETRDDGANRWNTNEFYGLALPQAYGEVGNDKINFKLGHFYSIVGYEGVQSVGNFFYSHAYSYQFAGPFTHWGGLLTWNVTDRLSVQGGVTNGWDALDRTTDRPGFLGGVKYQHESFWASAAVTTGDEINNAAGLPGLAPEFANRTRYSTLLGLYLTEKIEYVFHHWYGFQANGAPGAAPVGAAGVPRNAEWWGIDQYLYYTINCKWKVGFRGEWFYDQDGTRLGLNRPSNPNNPPLAGTIYSVALGLNYAPHENFVFRPEIRADFYDPISGGLPFDDGTRVNQLMVGVDGIVKF